MDKLAALSQIPMFQDLKPDVLEPILNLFMLKRFERGEFLWREGAQAHNFSFIVEGQIKISKLRSDGGETILGVFDDGDAVGQVAVFRRMDYPASAIALDTTTCLEIFRDHFLGTLRENEALLESLVFGMMQRNSQLVDRLAELSTTSAEKRLAMVFFKFSDKLGTRTKLEDGGMGVTIPVQLSRRDLADLINVRVETAIRMMSRWNKNGPVKTLPDGFLVTDCALLYELAHTDD